ncbi:MAG: PQQ-binding-like beta-propeller repeat protein [Planctomycetota bacterium]
MTSLHNACRYFVASGCRIWPIASLLSALLLRPAAAEDNWPQWRGPTGDGVGATCDYPAEFSPNKNVMWRASLPGRGSSTPAVWGDRIYVTCDVDQQDVVACYGLDGKERWQKTLGPGRAGRHKNGSGSNPSPVTDGRVVVVYFKSGRVACLTADGRELWSRNLQKEYGEDTLWWDLGTSPVLVEGKAIIAVMHEGESYLVALDLNSGDVVWREQRQYERPPESDQAYTTPNVTTLNGQTQLVVWGADHLTGHRVDSGDLIWEVSGFNPKNEGMQRVIASSAVSDGVAVVPFGRGDFLAAVALGTVGDLQAERLWIKEGLGADVPTPVAKDGKVYVLTDRGGVHCLDLKSGRELWSANLPRGRAKFYASPMLCGEKLCCAREDGAVFIGRVGDKGFQLLAENQLDEQLLATPLPIRNTLLVRTEGHLYRFGK